MYHLQISCQDPIRCTTGYTEPRVPVDRKPSREPYVDRPPYGPETTVYTKNEAIGMTADGRSTYTRRHLNTFEATGRLRINAWAMDVHRIRIGLERISHVVGEEGDPKCRSDPGPIPWDLSTSKPPDQYHGHPGIVRAANSFMGRVARQSTMTIQQCIERSHWWNCSERIVSKNERTPPDILPVADRTTATDNGG